jgi:uncharacterized protein YecE (DUF72 family)
MIRVGIGGWTFEPWRDNFYPKGLPHAKELEYASRQLTSIEVNGTFYSTMKPATYAKWAAETPDGFVFALKGPRYAVNRRELAGAGDSIKRFLDSGITELGGKLGPLLWQFAATKKFDAADLAKFLDLLPAKYGAASLRHVLEPRHESFKTPDFISMARAANVAVVVADSEKHPMIADVTADFVYARLQNAKATLKTGYAPAAIAAWAERARAWAGGGVPDDLPLITKPPAKAKARDVFVYMINGAKERAPAAAQALIKKLG